MKKIIFIKKYYGRTFRPANNIKFEAHVNGEVFDFTKLDFPNGKSYKGESPKHTEFLTW